MPKKQQPKQKQSRPPVEKGVSKKQRKPLEKEIAQLPTQLKSLSIQPSLEHGSEQAVVGGRQITKQEAEPPQIVKFEQQDAQVPPQKPKRKRHSKQKNKNQPLNPDERPSQEVVSGVVNGQQAAADGKDLVAKDANAQKPAANEKKAKKQRPPHQEPQPRPQGEVPGVDGGESGKSKKKRRHRGGKKKTSGGEGGPRPDASTP